jgi:hypothetical protein
LITNNTRIREWRDVGDPKQSDLITQVETTRVDLISKLPVVWVSLAGRPEVREAALLGNFIDQLIGIVP